MKTLSLAALVALFAGCTSVTDKDTGETGEADADTDTDTDADVDFAIGDNSGDTLGISGDCANNVCIYRITTTADAGVLELDMTETGDSYLYNENHTGFTLETENADGSSTYRLDLDWVTSLDDVVVNETTLFNELVSDGNIESRTTWYFGADSADGTDSDCRVTGHDPDWYSDWCTNVVR